MTVVAFQSVKKDQRTRKVSEQAAAAAAAAADAAADDDERNSELFAVRAARFGLLNIVMSIKKGLSLIHNTTSIAKCKDCRLWGDEGRPERRRLVAELSESVKLALHPSL